MGNLQYEPQIQGFTSGQDAATQAELDAAVAALNSGLPIVSVRSTIDGAAGAVGDFATIDDRSAIQRAMDKAGTIAAAAGSQALLWLDPGTYGFSIDGSTTNPKRAFTAKPGVIVTGPGKLKVRNSQGNYGAIFGNTSGTDVSGFELAGLNIDLNATNNAVPTLADMTVGDINEGRCLVNITRGDRVRVRDCVVRDVGDCVNLIYVNGDNTSADDFRCVDNQFLQVGQASFAHDCSVVYHHGRRGYVARNAFVARSTGLGGCTAAIEMHGPGQRVEDNYVENFMLGGYVTGISREASELSTWRRNRLVNVAGGIMVFPGIFNTFTSGYALRHVSVDRNVVIVDRDQWFARTELYGATGFASGIFLAEGSDLPADDVSITNNTIRYLASAQASDSGWSFKDAAIRWLRFGTTVVDRNLRITGNRTYNALGPGMLVWGKCDGVVIVDNHHIDPGSHVNLSAVIYRCGTVLLPTDPTCYRVNDNSTHDTRGTHLVFANVYLQPAGTVKDCEALDNLPTLCTDGTSQLNVYCATGAGTEFFMRQRTHGVFPTAPTITARFGSTITDEVSGKVWRQTATPGGSTWANIA